MFRIVNLNTILLCLVLLLSCSSQKPAETGAAEGKTEGKTASSTVSKPNTAYSLDIAPRDARRNTVFYIIPHNFTLSDARHIEWTVNGVSVSDGMSTSFKASEAKRGDIVRASITGPDFKILSDTVEIGNSPPEITAVKFMPEIFRPGDSLYAEVAASDPDGDPVTVFYEWTVDGQPAGREQRIGAPLKRGSKIVFKATPFDGMDYGTPFIIESVVANTPPVIEGHTQSSFDGTTYTYQVRASDADGDQLTYSLGASLPGMNINASTGLLTWIVPPGFKGVQPVTIIVNDGHGGTAQYIFNITIQK
jgi:Putative Ig domain